MAGSELEIFEFDESGSPDEAISDDRCHFSHQGWYWASFAYLAKDGQWYGKGCTSIGDYASWEYWPGTRLRAAVCFFGEHWFCDVQPGPGETVTLKGSAFDAYCEIGSRDDVIQALTQLASPSG